MTTQILYTTFIIIIFALSVVAMRIEIRRNYPHAIVGDVFFHLLCARAIRANGMRIPRVLPGFLWDTGYTYPPFYHWLLACFPENRRLVAERFTSVAFDLLQTTAVFGIAYHLFVQTGSGEQPLLKASAVAAANLLSPVFNAQIWGPRVVTGTARPLGEALFVLAVIAALLWELGLGIWFAGIAALLFGLLPLTSKFGFQVLIFFAVFLAVLFKWQWLLMIAVGIVLVWCLSGGLTGRVAMGHYRHSLFYFLYLQNHYFGLKRGQSGFFGTKEYINRVIDAIKSVLNIPKFLKWAIFERNFYHIMFFYNLHMWIVVASLLFLGLSSIENLPAGKLLALLGLAPLLPALLTSLPGLRFLGENYRYFEYYQWIYWVLLMAVSPAAFIIIAVIAGLFSIVLIHDSAKQVKVWNQDYVETEPFFSALRKQLTGESLFPLGGRYYECLYRTNLPILFWPANMRLEAVPLDDLKELFDSFPYPKPGTGFQQVIRTYGINYIICQKEVAACMPASNFDGLEHVEVPSCSMMLFRLPSHS
ncbi:MAG: hypothetical protein NDI81_08305 [Desulfobacula sp.]|nr:hypothetical protein [Desulfobacula sp.]